MNKPRLAQDIMVTRLVTLKPEDHVWFGISRLLGKKISGSPVVDDAQNFLGVFAEKSSMHVLIKTVERANGNNSGGLPRAQSCMASPPVTLRPDEDVFQAISFLLRRRISGAPVVDDDGNFLGSFSEKTSMQVLVAGAYDQLPTTAVSAFMDTSTQRLIQEDLDLLAAAQIFIDTPLRRLVVVRDSKVIGQVSRRDVLNAAWKQIGPGGTALVDAAADGSAESILAGSTVKDFMDTAAITVNEETDLLALAQTFLNSPYRRFPVVRDGRLVGQVSRRDLLHATNQLMDIATPRESSLLYLSSLHDRDNAPIQ